MTLQVKMRSDQEAELWPEAAELEAQVSFH